MESRESIPEFYEDAKTSAMRSADFWINRNPTLSVELLSFANHYDELVAEHEGKFVLISGSGDIEGIFENEDEAYKFSEKNLQGKKSGLIHPISTAGIKTSDVYQALVPTEIWEKYKKVNLKPTVYSSIPLDKEYVNQSGSSPKPS